MLDENIHRKKHILQSGFDNTAVPCNKATMTLHHSKSYCCCFKKMSQVNTWNVCTFPIVEVWDGLSFHFSTALLHIKIDTTTLLQIKHGSTQHKSSCLIPCTGKFYPTDNFEFLQWYTIEKNNCFDNSRVLNSFLIVL